MPPRPSGPSELIESRRHRALALLDRGNSINEVGRMIGCSGSSVMRWRDAREKEGADGLKVKYSPGRPLKLKRKERAKLFRLLLKGAISLGYETDLWTTARISEVIEKEFQVQYHRDHVGRLLKSGGWSHQAPERRSIERDEVEIENWRRKEWSRVKKTPVGWAPTSFS
jgi:transposase